MSQYIVITPEGKKFGPTDFQTLSGWVRDGRIAPGMMVEDVLSGQTMTAESVPGLFDGEVAYPRLRGVPVENHGLASLICGLIGMVTWCFWFIGLPLAASAIILGSRSLRSEGRTMALIGIILGCFGVLLCIAELVFAAMIMDWMKGFR